MKKEMQKAEDNSVQSGEDNSVQKAGYNSVQKAGSNSVQKAGRYSVQTGGRYSAQTAEDNSVQIGGLNSVQTAKGNSVQIGGYNSVQTGALNSVQIGVGHLTQTGGRNSMQNAEDNSVQSAKDNSVQKAGYNSVQTAKGNSVQKAGSNSVQTAKDNSVQKAGSNSVQTAKDNSTCIGEFCTTVIANGTNIVARRVDVPQVLILNNQTIRWCPMNIEGYLELIDDKWYLDGDESLGEYIIADGILSKVVKSKGDVYHVINHDEDDITYLVHKDGFYAHDKTLAEAKDSLRFKIADKDLSKYEDYDYDTVLTIDDAITMYRSITGACEYGVKSFLKNANISKDKISVSEIVEITKGNYGNGDLVKFFKKGETK